MTPATVVGMFPNYSARKQRSTACRDQGFNPAQNRAEPVRAMTTFARAAIGKASEKRIKPRRWRLEGGRISPPDGVFSLPCMIVDINEGGARVRVREQLNMPARVQLFDTRERLVYTADLVWSGPPEYGLRFIGKTLF